MSAPDTSETQQVVDLVRFPPPVDPQEHCIYQDWDHERWPYAHWYRVEEIVITRDRNGYRWHIPHGASGFARSPKAAHSKARKAVDYPNAPGNYGDSITAVRRYGSATRTVSESTYRVDGWLAMSDGWLVSLAVGALKELSARGRPLDHQPLREAISGLLDDSEESRQW